MNKYLDTKDLEIIVHELEAPDTHFKTIKFDEFMRVVRAELEKGEYNE